VRILIVEDNAGYAEALETAISLIDGYMVRGCVASGAQALAFAQTHSGEIDTVILDLRLPEGGGLEVLPELKQRLPAASVIVLTQSGKEHDVVQALSRGADGYILKSSSIAQIAAALESLATGGTPIDAQVAGLLLGQFRDQATETAELGVLTDREVEVLGLLAQGRTKKEISSELFVSYATVDSHVRNIYGKLKARNVAEAITIGYKTSLIRME
jgi:DNA-binding NarL/FixJ family response regulator